MGTVTNAEVCRRIKQLIKTGYQHLEWNGITLKDGEFVEDVSVNIDDGNFYSGKDDYHFGGRISFMVNTVHNGDTVIGLSSKIYDIPSQNNKVSIRENNNELEIKINEPIIVTPHQQYL